MMPARDEAFALLGDAWAKNPGPWREHSLVAAKCAEKIAGRCADLDAEKAFVLGLLHDIGRREGATHLAHTIDGYDFLLSLGYGEAARVCLTHSFQNQTLDDYIGAFDVCAERLEKIRALLAQIEYDDYDRLVQLCDAIALPSGPVPVLARMADVKNRYGAYPEAKWKKNLWLKAYFEQKTALDIDGLAASI